MSATPCKHGPLLLVEDDEAFVHVLSRSLQKHGFSVFPAGTVDDALALARTIRPAYVLLDLNLGGQSGLKLIAPILEAMPDARLVVLTGYASIATAVNAVKLGAVEYLTKPARIGLIVSTLLGKDEGAEQDVAPEEWLTVKSLEWEYLQRALAENGGNISATARALKMHRRTLQRKLGKKRPQDREP
ncbi:response regulator [Zoogloea sp.]|uniref:response regulator transcription factor n=1 Tax=Zoogloea sp. TaxID=49181 RepID=UPI001AC8DC4B|nr:response regulator [Zoogloea sp.]MBN8284375.1 response regulator [Zoogloea sp.]